MRGILSGRWFKFNGPHELAGDTSRMMVPSGFLFLRGLPNLHSVSLEAAVKR